MKITILNGNPEVSNSAFEDYLAQLSDKLDSYGHEVTSFELREMDISYCIGCFGCWVKSPGKCRSEDESRLVSQAYINSDFVLYASPVIMGFYSAVLKKVTDKFIQLVEPYMEFVDGESRHLARYDRYPLVGLLLEKGADCDDDDISIIADTHKNTALNFKSRLVFTKLTDNPVDDVAQAIVAPV
jgi:hypothetical protein